MTIKPWIKKFLVLFLATFLTLNSTKGFANTTANKIMSQPNKLHVNVFLESYQMDVYLNGKVFMHNNKPFSIKIGSGKLGWRPSPGDYKLRYKVDKQGLSRRINFAGWTKPNDPKIPRAACNVQVVRVDGRPAVSRSPDAFVSFHTHPVSFEHSSLAACKEGLSDEQAKALPDLFRAGNLSHGCIRLPIIWARVFFQLAQDYPDMIISFR